MVAFPDEVELHVPPVVASLRDVIPPPSQAVGVPEIAGGAAGAALTVTTRVEAALPQLLAMV